MGGMAPASGHHTGVKSLASYVRGNPPTYGHHVGLELHVSKVLILCQALKKMKQMLASIVLILCQAR